MEFPIAIAIPTVFLELTATLSMVFVTGRIPYLHPGSTAFLLMARTQSRFLISLEMDSLSSGAVTSEDVLKELAVIVVLLAVEQQMEVL